MKEISVNAIRDVLANMVQDINVNYPSDIYELLQQANTQETNDLAKDTLGILLDNAKIAKQEKIPVCQDTGMAIVFLKIGQDVHLIDGDLTEAVNAGVAAGYEAGYLRKSVVDDPLYERINTKNNTPCILYTEIIPGEKVIIEVAAKGFGSENKSTLTMLTPADGEEGVIQTVLEAIKNAGPNACPPMVVGVGIGGTFDYAAVLAKKALLRDSRTTNSNPAYAKLEKKLLQLANETGIGPQGFGGDATALAINVEYFPTHIAGLPVAVNISCHITRHAKEVLS
ncbi:MULTISPECIES: fumarate hydratase [unclassified Breznakia]|uniref:fumarate hydratase n=1 Tax=unclassified Breznakia TaxID=2623764 RepID=UPI0024748946|nr:MULTISPECIES: fumarate hydratase [unclassified Breznakia]MDH6368196.1 fumarate hydratase subunit alpha [Breznakia sp. PH1-1]MDH6405283.1 fumarate hydratase subunit alpha [Breznakia sp. PF1-11]MDH6412998.1 fumarate hydratase subunit alpha [Breznakia sp. PFB1-11]MDH6415358.1 fumarate hydratase subunit alpha [Breznakia sp. PFB1-14]MDH6417665.1 fumarate hydratase subunit alpha [Breznakia sp. PFB1-4]